jgi:hypothetical protein
MAGALAPNRAILKAFSGLDGFKSRLRAIGRPGSPTPRNRGRSRPALDVAVRAFLAILLKLYATALLRKSNHQRVVGAGSLRGAPHNILHVSTFQLFCAPFLFLGLSVNPILIRKASAWLRSQTGSGPCEAGCAAPPSATYYCLGGCKEFGGGFRYSVIRRPFGILTGC